MSRRSLSHDGRGISVANIHAEKRGSHESSYAKLHAHFAVIMGGSQGPETGLSQGDKGYAAFRDNVRR